MVAIASWQASLRSVRVVPALVLGCGLALSAQADTASAAPDHAFKLSLGGYSIIKSDTTLSLTERNYGTGLALNPSDTLGVDVEQTVFRLDADYRFTPEHALHFSWFRIATDGKRTLAQDISWVDDNGNEITLAAGAKVDTQFNYDIYSLQYGWTFYHNDKVELYTIAGLHTTRFALGLDVEASAGGGSSVNARNVASTVPLPVLGLGIEYQISPRLSWFMQSQFFALSYSDWNGSFSDVQIAMEYQLLDYLSVGAGIGTDTLEVTEKTNDYKFTYNNKLTGINLFVSTQF